MSLNVVIPDTFNGPLGLLHSLIVRDEIDIYDIPIAKLAASYCEEIGKMAVIDIDEGTEFLDLASRLQDIKLRMLLPPEERPDGGEDEDEIDDPRSGLVESLLEYRRFKDAARLLGELAEEQERRFPRVPPRMEFRFVEPETGEENDGLGLLVAMQSMLDRLSAPEVIESREVPIATRIEQIREVLARRETSRFSLLLSSAPARREIVAFFIAMLELIRRGELRARQTDSFSDIILERCLPERETAGGIRFARGRARARKTRCFPAAMPPSAPRAATRKPARDSVPRGKRPAAFPAAAIPAASRGTEAVRKNSPPAGKGTRVFPAAVPRVSGIASCTRRRSR